jgi:hypothetical protein
MTMETLSLKSKWDLLSNESLENGFKALRISANCLPELFIALDSNNNPSLLLFAEEDVDLLFKGAEKDKLSLSLNLPSQVLVLKLKDANYVDLFNDLILSLYNRVFQISDNRTSIQEFVNTFYKWAEFFEEPDKNKLSIEQVKGIIGELHYLKEILTKSTLGNIDLQLESWMGPYETSNDFVFDQKNVEIKTKDPSGQLIKISSAFQLEIEPLKKLELVVVSMQPDYINGISLKDSITVCLDLIRGRYGNISIFLKALRQIGLSPEASKDYDNLKFRIVNSNVYDCSGDNFPKLTTQNIPLGISNLKYSLNVSTIEEFLIKETIY